MGNKASVKPKDRHDILGATNLALMQFLIEIPDTPQALLVVVVTTYSTWHLRTTYVVGPLEHRRTRQARLAENEDDEDDHGMESDGESDLIGSRRKSWVPEIFDRIICDEAQKIKDMFIIKGA